MANAPNVVTLDAGAGQGLGVKPAHVGVRLNAMIGTGNGGGDTFYWLLEDGSGYWELEDGSGLWLLEDAP